MIIVMPDATRFIKLFNLLDGTYNYEDFFSRIDSAYRENNISAYWKGKSLSCYLRFVYGEVVSVVLCSSLSEMFVTAAPLLSAVGGHGHSIRWRVNQIYRRCQKKKRKFSGKWIYKLSWEISERKARPYQWIRWYISCSDDDFYQPTNCLLHNTLLQHQVGHEFRMKDGSHSWTYWRMELQRLCDLFLEYLLNIERK